MRKIIYRMTPYAIGALISGGIVNIFAGTNNLVTETTQVIQRQMINKFKTALSGDVVPRDSSGNVTDVGANVGSSTYRWDHVYARTLAIQQDSTANDVSITIPNPLASPYPIILPSALPVSTRILSLDSSGHVATGVAATIVDNDITAGTITGSSLHNSTITGTQIVDHVDLPGKHARESGANLVVSNANATNSLSILRGSVIANGTASAGEGFSVASHPSTGIYNVTFSTSFGDTPIVIGTGFSAVTNPIICVVSAVSASGFTMVLFNSSESLVSETFQFIAVGPRN